MFASTNGNKGMGGINTVCDLAPFKERFIKINRPSCCHLAGVVDEVA
jgi:hypothetical protein